MIELCLFFLRIIFQSLLVLPSIVYADPNKKNPIQIRFTLRKKVSPVSVSDCLQTKAKTILLSKKGKNDFVIK